jgi:hypothetical protein
MLTAGCLSLFSVIFTMLIETKYLSVKVPGLILTLIDQPAIWGVPLSIILMVIVSKMTRNSIPKDVDLKMLRLHAPEEMGMSKNYIEH